MSRTAPTKSVEEEAAEIFLQLRDDMASPEQIEEALDWAESSAEREAALARVEKLWNASDVLPRPALPIMLGEEVSRAHDGLVANSGSPIGWGRWVALAACLAIAAIGVLLFHQPEFQGKSLHYATVVGENRAVTLEDGSVVTLGGASEISVEYTKGLRHLILLDGEALFKVAPSRARPFVVESSGGETWAVGTEFDVRRGLQGVTVNLIEGFVQVQSIAAPQTAGTLASVRLSPGTQVRYSATGEFGSVEPISKARALAWQEGKLIFVDSSLAEIVLDLNRYSPRVISINGDALKHLRFSGVVMTDRIAEWLSALQSSLPLRVEETGNGLTLSSPALER